MNNQEQTTSTVFTRLSATFSVFSGNQGPSRQEVQETLDGARKGIESLQETRRQASVIHNQTQAVLSQARAANSPQA